jgi:hypothetical protein
LFICLFLLTRDNIAKSLFDVGIELKRIEVVGDDKNDIAESVRSLSLKYDLVFTSGGIGKQVNEQQLIHSYIYFVVFILVMLNNTYFIT